MFFSMKFPELIITFISSSTRLQLQRTSYISVLFENFNPVTYEFILKAFFLAENNVERWCRQNYSHKWAPFCVFL